jgi:diguanylate cyclase (GGDEF)-like protein
VLRRRGRDALQALIDAGLNVTRGRPLEGDGVLLRCLPWVAAGMLAYSFLFLLGDWPTTGDLVALAIVPLVVGSAVLVPWERLPMWMQAIPLLLPFAAVALVRSSHESVTATYTPVVLLPVIWFAFYGTRRQLLFSLLCLGVTLAIPSPAFEGYPALEPLAAVFWMGVAAIMGFSINEFVLERERLQAQLGRMARTDALTGLPNRRAWDELLTHELAIGERHGVPVSVAMLDLDFFKRYNDERGHLAGDRLLRAAAAAWQSSLRATDVLARWGGEEFAVLLPGCDGAGAAALIERLRGTLPDGVTFSAGVATAAGTTAARALVDAADQALYVAKQAGRDRVVVG